MIFVDRSDAGHRLGNRLYHLKDQDVVVVGLPRGGVPVAAEVARVLDAPLDVVIVRKLGVPFQPELAMGAISEGDVRFVNQDIVASARVTGQELADVEARERKELERRAESFRRGRPRVDLAGRTVIVVDDGIATGATARVACRAARAQGARYVVLATPVAPSGWAVRLDKVADELVALATPALFGGVGQWYEDFSQTSDAEVIASLQSAPAGEPARADAGAGGGDGDPPGEGTAADRDALPPWDEVVDIPAGPVRLAGRLTLPPGASGLVVFVHGSGSSRNSPRNRYVASVLNDAGLGTLLFDLLTIDEEVERSHVFDIELLADRLTETTRWVRAEPEVQGLAIGYFGASTGAAAALWAASQPGADIGAIVSRGGRPDLAGPRLAATSTPTLLIVGGHDHLVLDLNRDALEGLRGEKRMELVPGATHLFEEPGALDQVAALACDWFVEHLVPVATRH